MSSSLESRSGQGPGGPRPSDQPLDLDGPSFALRFEAGIGVLSLVRPVAEGPITLEVLELGIPELRFPLEVTGGAQRFQTSRLTVLRATVALDLDALASDLCRKLSQFDLRRLDLGPGGVTASMGRGIALAFDLGAEPSVSQSSDISLLISRVRSVGPVGVAPTMLAKQLVIAATRLASPSPAETSTRTEPILQGPLRVICKALLCARGWRLPSQGEARFIRCSWSAGRLQVEFGSGATEGGGTDVQSLARLEGLRLCRTADERLQRGEAGAARAALVDALALDPEEPQLLLRLAEIDAVDPARAEGALGLCAELSMFAPNDVASVHAIAALAHEALGRPTHGATCLEELARCESDGRLKAAALSRAAMLCQPVDPERAYGLLWSAVRGRAADGEAIGRLFDLAITMDRRTDLDKLVPIALGCTENARDRAVLLARYGEALRERFGAADEARAVLERALRLDPECDPALAALSVATTDSDPARAVRTLSRLAELRIARGDAAGASTAHLLAGQALAGPLGDLAHAAARFREATRLDPSMHGAWRSYGRACAALGRNEEAVTAFGHFLDASLGQRQPLPGTGGVLVDLSKVHSERGCLEDALQAAQKALELGGAQQGALRQIELIHFVRADWKALSDHHGWAAAVEPERAPLHLRERARILDQRLGEPEESLRVLESALALEPSDLGANEAVLELARRLGDIGSRRAALERLARLRNATEQRAAALCELADLLIGTADPRGALAALAAAHELEPLSPEVAERMVELRRRIGEPLGLADALVRHAAILEARGARADAHDRLVEAGRAYCRGGKLDEASAILRRALVYASGIDRARTLLYIAETDERRGAYAEARMAYSELRASGHASERARLAEGAVAEHLGDDEGALQLYETVLESPDPAHTNKARGRLVALHRRRGDDAAAADVLERAGRVLADSCDASDLLYQAAQIRLSQLGDLVGGERALWLAAERNPGHLQALRRLTLLGEQRNDRAALLRALELRSAIREERIDVLSALGALYGGPLGDAARTEQVYSMLLEEQPDNESALAVLGRACLGRGELHRSREYFLRLNGVAQTPALRAEGALQSGRLLLAAGDLPAAEANLRLALQLGTAPIEVLPALDDTLGKLGKHEERAQIIAQRIDLSAGAGLEDLLCSLAELEEGALEAPLRAAATVRRLAELEPSAAERLLWLARLCERNGDPLGQGDALEQAAFRTAEHDEAARLLVASADALGRTEPAAETRQRRLLEMALERDPSCVAAATRLDPHLARAGEHDARVRVHGRVAQTCGDPKGRATALLLRATVRFEALGDLPSALEDALAAAPYLPVQASGLVASMARRNGDPATETAALTALLEAAPLASDDAIAVHRRLAELLAGDLAELGRAAVHLRAVVDLDPEDDDARQTLASLLEQIGEHEARADLVLAEAARIEAMGRDPEPLRKSAAESLVRGAEQDARHGRTPSAIAKLEKALGLGLGPEIDEPNAERLDGLYAGAGELHRRLALLTSRADGRAPEEARALLGRMVGQLDGDEGIDFDKRLINLGDDAALARQVARCREAADLPGVVTVLAQAAMRAEPGAARVTALLAVVQAAREASDDDAIEDALREAILEDPTAPTAVDELALHYEARADLQSAVSVLADAELAHTEPARKAELLRRRAELLGRLGDDDGAIDALTNALPLAPEDPRLLADLEAAYRRTERWMMLTALLAARLRELPPSQARAEIAVELANVTEHNLNDLSGAARMYLQAALVSPPGVFAADAAGRASELARRTGEHALAAEALQVRADASPVPDDAADALCARAELLRSAGRYEEVGPALEQALSRCPGHAPAQLALGLERLGAGDQEEAQALLEGYLASAPDPAVSVPALAALAQICESSADVDAAIGYHRLRAAILTQDPEPLQAVARLELGRGNVGDALVALEAVASILPDEAQRAEVHLERAELMRDRLGDLGGASRELLSAAELQPRTTESADQALALALQSESWSDAVGALGILIERTDEPPRQRELLAARARVKSQHLGDADGATDDLLQAILLEPGPSSDDLHHAVVELAFAAGRIEVGLDSLDHVLARRPAISDLPLLCLRGAQIAETAGYLDRARVLYREALELGAPDPAAIASHLASLLDEHGNADELREILEIQLAAQTLDTVEDAQEKASVLRRLAALALRQSDEETAAAYFRALLVVAPTDPTANAQLRRIYQHRGAWDELSALVRDQLENTEEKSERVALLYERARLEQDKFGRELEANQLLTQALELDPEHLPTLDALADLAYRRADFPRADGLYQRLGTEGLLAPDVVLVRRAECAERLGRSSESVEHYRAALAANPANSRAAEALGRVFVQSGRPAEAAQELQRAVELCPPQDTARSAELQLLLGEALIRAGQFADAAEPLRAASELMRGDPQPLLMLRDVYLELRRWQDAIWASEKLKQLAATARGKAELEFRIGEIKRAHIKDPEALSHFERAHDLDPSHLPTLRRLVVQYSDLGSYQQCLDKLRELWPKDPSCRRNSRLLYAAAVAASESSDRDSVRALLEEAERDARGDPGPSLALARLSADSDPPGARAALARARELGASDEAVEALQELLGAPGTTNDEDRGRAARRMTPGREPVPVDVQVLTLLADEATDTGDDATARRIRSVIAFLEPTAEKLGRFPPRVLDEHEADALYEDAARTPLAHAIRIARTAFRPSSSDIAAPGAMLGPDGPPEVFESTSQARRLVGGVSVELYVLDDTSTNIAIKNAEPPRLLFGKRFVAMSGPERLFLAARALCRVSTGEGALEELTAADVHSRLLSLYRAVGGGHVGPSDDPQQDRALVTLHPREREALQAALKDGLEDATVESVDATLLAMRLGAARVALSATRDATAALSATARDELGGELPSSSEERIRLVTNSVTLRDLFEFAVTAEP